MLALADRAVDFRDCPHEFGKETVRRTSRVATRFETGAALASGRRSGNRKISAAREPALSEV